VELVAVAAEEKAKASLPRMRVVRVLVHRRTEKVRSDFNHAMI
jgi:hypothetical protein